MSTGGEDHEICEHVILVTRISATNKEEFLSFAIICRIVPAKVVHYTLLCSSVRDLSRDHEQSKRQKRADFLLVLLVFGDSQRWQADSKLSVHDRRIPYRQIRRFGEIDEYHGRQSRRSNWYRPQADIYTGSAQNWDHMDPSLPKVLKMP